MQKIVFGVAIFFLSVSFQRLLVADTKLEMGATVIPSILVTLEGGRNARGKSTAFISNQIDFGNVSFINPDNIANGDAFRQGNNLILEAVLNVSIDFNGADNVSLSLSKLKTSINSFAKSSFSLLNSIDGPSSKILEYPRSSRIATLHEPSTLMLRLLFDISPQQTGRIYDQFQLEVSPQ